MSKKVICIGASILAFLLYICVFLTIVNHNKEPYIYELTDEHIYAVVGPTDYRYFVVARPPQNIEEIKELVESFTVEYIRDNPETTEVDENASFHWMFLRESKDINANWVANEGYLSIDRIEDHFDDLIASVCWDAGDTTFRYYVDIRSQHFWNYGEILEHQYFSNDIS